MAEKQRLVCPICKEKTGAIDLSDLRSMEGEIVFETRCHNRRRCAGRPVIRWRVKGGRIEPQSLTPFRRAS